MKQKISLSIISLALIAFLAVVPVGLTAAYLISKTASGLETNTRQTVRFYNNQFAERAENIMRSLGGNIYILTTDRQISEALQLAKKGDTSAMAGAEDNAAKIFLSTGWEQNSITGIFIVQNQTNFLSVLRGGIYSGGANRALTVWKEFENTNSARSLVATKSCPGYSYLVADYMDINTMRPLGKIIIEMNTSAFVSNPYIGTMHNGAKTVLSDLSGQVLYAGDDDEFASIVAQSNFSNENYVTVKNEEYYHTSQRLGNYNLKIDVLIPKSQIFATIYDAVQLYIVVIICILLITLLLGFAAFTFLTRPLKQMVVAIDKVAAGKLSTHMPHTPYKETERISVAFNDMTTHLQTLFDEVYQSGVYLREAEYRSLEAQINPHFLFNVLEVINMRAMATGQHDICTMVSNLAGLLRSNTIHVEKQKLSFGQELEYVKFYLLLQKERFGDALQYDIKVEDDSLLSLFLPKLTIQPIVENSIVHGLENKRGGGRVSIFIWEEEEGIFIRVCDDGIGFDVNLVKLETPPKEASERHNHVALYNIHRRIKLLYGDEYGLQVKSNSGHGSEVTVRLPIDEKSGAKGGEASA